MPGSGHFSMFVHTFYQQFRERGFSPISDAPVDENLEQDGFLALISNEGGVMYVAAAYNAGSSSGFQTARLKFTDSVTQFAKRTNARNVIIFQIYYQTDLESGSFDELKQYADENALEYEGQQIYEIHYALSPVDGESYCNKKQPSNIIKMDSLLTEILQTAAQMPTLGVNPTEPPKKSLPLFPEAKTEFLVYIILAVNALLFALMELNGSSEDIYTLINFGALYSFPLSEINEYYRFFTAMFLHIGVMHLLYNSVSLYIFGQRIEKYYGRVRFLFIYLLTGIMGNISAYIFSGYYVAAGASGAIFGLMGAALAITQTNRKPLDGVSNYTLILFAISGILFGFMYENIANSAHLGGLISGYIIGLIMCLVQKHKVKR